MDWPLIERTDQPELARQFMEYLVGDAAQTVLPVTNWMCPVVAPEAGPPPAFGGTGLILVALLLSLFRLFDRGGRIDADA